MNEIEVYLVKKQIIFGSAKKIYSCYLIELSNCKTCQVDQQSWENSSKYNNLSLTQYAVLSYPY